MASRRDHPRTRFYRYLQRTWGIEDAKELDDFEKQLAVADWQVQELRNGQGSPSRLQRMMPVAERGGPWAVVTALIAYLIQRGG